MIKTEYYKDLTRMNTFGMKVKARCFIEYDSVADLVDIEFEELARPVLHIGGGSNLLFTDDFKGTVLHSKIDFIEILDECHRIPEAPAFASSGTSYPVNHPKNPQIFGDPEKVGKCLLHTNGTSPEDSNASSKHYLASAEGQRITPSLIRKVIIGIRKEKLPEPSVMGSAGSFFKNPVISMEHFQKIEAAAKAECGPDCRVPHYDLPDGTVKVPAAWMIEQCGWKGRRSGGAAVWEKQPLVIVNYTGEAYPEEIIGLERRIIASVKEKFNIELHPEVEHI